MFNRLMQWIRPENLVKLKVVLIFGESMRTVPAGRR